MAPPVEHGSVRAGALRHRVTLEVPTGVADATGDPVPGWTVAAVVWAAVVPLSGQERLAAQQVVADVSHQVTLRYRADVTPHMRIRLGSRLFNILAVINPEERNRTLELLALEVLA